jgi:glycogen operon protein
VPRTAGEATTGGTAPAGGAAVAEGAADLDLLEFTQTLIRLRAGHPVFRRRRFFHGQAIRGEYGHLGDIAWFTSGGQEMADADWESGFTKSLTVFLNGSAISEPGGRGEHITDDSFLLLFNASEQDLDFILPPALYGSVWHKALDTALTAGAAGPAEDSKAGDKVAVTSRSIQVLRHA